MRSSLSRIPRKRRRPGSPFLGFLVFLVAVAAVAGAGYWCWRKGILLDFRPPLVVENILSGMDTNGNGIDDSLDIVVGARKQVEARPVYKSAYYEGGYPPENEGVCTDLVWRALWHAGYDFKASVDRDIAAAVEHYPRVGGRPDPNIDFRRVPNLYVFLSRTAESLTTEVKPWDADNAREWQPGDIVIFGDSYDHIGVVSDKRMRNGIPLIIHHGWGHPVEDNALGYGKDWVSAHFRLRLDKLDVR